MAKIKALFLDIGGVLMTNGWDHHSREKAAEEFGFDYASFDARHREYYNLYETGALSLDAYLKQAIFCEKRNFTLDQFKDFMFAQSRPYPEVLQFMHQIKNQYRLKIALVSNEGREISLYRIRIADLKSLAQYFFISCFVHIQKPNPSIYQMALDVTQFPKEEVFYIDDRPNMVEEAAKLGINGWANTNFEATKEKLLSLLGF